MSSQEKQTNLEGGFVEVPRKNLNIWLPETQGEMLQGKIVSHETGQYGAYLNIQKSDGEVIMTPSHAILQSYIPELKDGTEVRITLIGYKKTKNGVANDYKVFIKA
jgi:hypothetical protein